VSRHPRKLPARSSERSRPPEPRAPAAPHPAPAPPRIGFHIPVIPSRGQAHPKAASGTSGAKVKPPRVT
jgi:hypothetical protein